MQEATEKAVLALNEQKPDPYEPFRTLDVATLQKRYTKAALIEIAKALGIDTAKLTSEKKLIESIKQELP